MTTAAAVVVAAGEGTRLGDAHSTIPKALVEVAGRTLVELALGGLRAVGRFDRIVVVHTPGHEEAFRAVVGDRVSLAPGGATRSDSVRAGVGALGDGLPDLVAIHDAARALVPLAVVDRTLAAVEGDVVAAAPGLPVADTLKDATEEGEVRGTVERSGLWAVHTPQVIRGDVLAAVLAWAPQREATDDLGLVEDALAAGIVDGRVRLVRGDPRDLKITYPEDLALAAAVVDGMRP